MITLNLNDVVVFEGRIYRVERTAYSNGKMQGHRVILKLMREEELAKMVIENNQKEVIINNHEENKS